MDFKQLLEVGTLRMLNDVITITIVIFIVVRTVTIGQYRLKVEKKFMDRGYTPKLAVGRINQHGTFLNMWFRWKCWKIEQFFPPSFLR